MASPGGQILNYYKWNHIQLVKFGTNASGILFLLAGEITQVKESIPVVRCASGNVWMNVCRLPFVFKWANIESKFPPKK